MCISLKKGYEGLMMPKKLYEIIAVGRPVIFEGSLLSEAANVIVQGNCGHVISPSNEKELEKVILGYYKNRDEVKSHGENAKRHI
jgi:putative colanic acid biosynthesis glycosyltransferase WcaI